MALQTVRGSLTQEVIDQVVSRLRPRLKRVMALLNGKGGTGKTTVTVNCGVTLADALVKAGSTKRVLLLQLDQQGDLGLDLGIRYSDKDDDGLSILQCVTGAGPLKVARDVRPHLDVVTGGSELKSLSGFLKGSDKTSKTKARLRFAQALADMADDYEWILLDCPPGDEELQVLGLVACRWVLIPAQFDAASRFGLEGVAGGFEEATPLNPDLELLGVLMFSFDRRDQKKLTSEGQVTGYREVGQRARVRKRLVGDLERIGSDAPVFTAVISNCRAVAEDCRETGRTASEVADASANNDWRRSRTKAGLSAFSNDTAEALAVDYEDATVEIFGRAKELEAEDAA